MFFLIGFVYPEPIRVACSRWDAEKVCWLGRLSWISFREDTTSPAVLTLENAAVALRENSDFQCTQACHLLHTLHSNTCSLCFGGKASVLPSPFTLMFLSSIHSSSSLDMFSSHGTCLSSPSVLSFPVLQKPNDFAPVRAESILSILMWIRPSHKDRQTKKHDNYVQMLWMIAFARYWALAWDIFKG